MTLISGEGGDGSERSDLSEAFNKRFNSERPPIYLPPRFLNHSKEIPFAVPTTAADLDDDINSQGHFWKCSTRPNNFSDPNL